MRDGEDREERGFVVRVEGKGRVVVRVLEGKGKVVVRDCDLRGHVDGVCCLGVYSEAFKGKKKNSQTSRVFYMYARHCFSKSCKAH